MRTLNRNDEKVQRKSQEHMKQWIKDSVGLGALFWVIGYLASLALFFSPFAASMGWILLALCTPVTVAVTWLWFRHRNLLLPYYVRVGIVWTTMAIVLDYLFIVLLFNATYYGADVFIYYFLTFLIPVIVGFSLVNSRKKPTETQE